MTSSTSAGNTSSQWKYGRAHIAGDIHTPNDVTLAYIDCPASTSTGEKSPRGTIVLIHGFPQTSYQFRHVITPLSTAGYRVVVLDYRGAGYSSHPRSGYTKTTMAADIHTLLHGHLGITDKVHVVGHDIGGMVAHAYATQFSDHTASVTWGECPLPGSQAYERIKHNPPFWHFAFHQQADLPESLVAGHEDTYLEHFYARHAQNQSMLTQEDFQHYVRMFKQAGAFRCGFDTYRAFNEDARENVEWLDRHGKCEVPCLSLHGEAGHMLDIAEEQTREMYTNVDVQTVPGSGHWIAEENPAGFVDCVLGFVGRYS